MKKFILVLAVLALVSCSKDDGDATEEDTIIGEDDNITEDDNPPVVALYLKTFKVERPNENPLNIELEYNSQKQVASVNGTGTAFDAVCTYEAGKIKTITKADGGFVFSYTNNVLTSVMVDNDVINVDYNSDSKTYTFNEWGTDYTLDENNNLVLAKYQLIDHVATTLLTYDLTKQGAIYNHASPNNFFIPLFLQFLTYVSPNVLKSYDGYDVVNTFNNAGLPTTAVHKLEGATILTVTYTYTEL